MENENLNRCSYRVRDQGRWPTYHRCTRKGIHSEDGKWYCGTHAPSLVEKRREAKDRNPELIKRRIDDLEREIRWRQTDIDALKKKLEQIETQ